MLAQIENQGAFTSIINFHLNQPASVFENLGHHGLSTVKRLFLYTISNGSFDG